MPRGLDLGGGQWAQWVSSGLLGHGDLRREWSIAHSFRRHGCIFTAGRIDGCVRAACLVSQCGLIEALLLGGKYQGRCTKDEAGGSAALKREVHHIQRMTLAIH
jgi:hypothetical protein